MTPPDARGSLLFLWKRCHVTLLLLQTGDPPPRAQTTYADLFRSALEVEDLIVADARRQEFPQGAWSGVVITGSASSTYADLPWVALAEDYLRQLAAREIPLYGVCFGHQLLAQTFGGRVERCPAGWELGTTRVELTALGRQDPLFSGFPASFAVQQSHADVVTRLPEGAEILAGNSHWGIQAYRLGPRIWGTQFHPEFTPRVMAAAIERVSPLLGETDLPQRPAHEPVAQWLTRSIEETPVAQSCLANFARLVR